MLKRKNFSFFRYHNTDKKVSVIHGIGLKNISQQTVLQTSLQKQMINPKYSRKHNIVG